MQSSQSWQARHDELKASLRRTGALLGDPGIPAQQREQINAQFVSTWQEFTQHMKQHPDMVGSRQ